MIRRPAAAFGDEHLPVGEERQAPRVVQAPRHDDDADFVLFSGIEDKRSRAERRPADPDGRASALLGR